MVAIKRVAPEVASALLMEETPAEAPRGLTEAEMRAHGMEQWTEMSAMAMDDLTRFANGWLKYREKGWKWEEPDWDTDPETWPPLAKVMWLYVRSHDAITQAQWLRHMTAHPGWCRECHDGEDRPLGWTGTYHVCPRHVSNRCVEHLVGGLLHEGEKR